MTIFDNVKAGLTRLNSKLVWGFGMLNDNGPMLYAARKVQDRNPLERSDHELSCPL